MRPKSSRIGTCRSCQSSHWWRRQGDALAASPHLLWFKWHIEHWFSRHQLCDFFPSFRSLPPSPSPSLLARFPHLPRPTSLPPSFPASLFFLSFFLPLSLIDQISAFPRQPDGSGRGGGGIEGKLRNEPKTVRRTNERTDRMSSDGGRSLHRHGVGWARAGWVPLTTHRLWPFRRPFPRPSAFRPTGRDPFEMKHTHFFLVSPNGRADRGCGRGRGGRGGGNERETEGGRDLPPARRQTFIRGRRRRTRTWTSSTIAASRGEDGQMRTRREGGRVDVAERHVITDYSGAAGAIAMPAERRSGSGGLTSIRQTGRTRRTGRTEGGLAWHRKSAVIRGENIPGNSLENFLGIR